MLYSHQVIKQPKVALCSYAFCKLLKYTHAYTRLCLLESRSNTSCTRAIQKRSGRDKMLMMMYLPVSLECDSVRDRAAHTHTHNSSVLDFEEIV